MIYKLAITVLNELIFFYHDVVVAFGVTVLFFFFQENKAKQMLAFDENCHWCLVAFGAATVLAVIVITSLLCGSFCNVNTVRRNWFSLPLNITGRLCSVIVVLPGHRDYYSKCFE